MEKITGFHLDEDNHWVADLSCATLSMSGIIHLGNKENGFCQITDVMTL